MARIVRARACGLTAVAVLVLAGCGGGRAPRVADATTQRATAAGEVVGFRGHYGSDVWLGIPYAAAPRGALRWRAPQPAPRWTGVRRALTFGAPCVQYTSPLFGVDGRRANLPAGSEDCLYLNVWAPHGGAPAAHLPVMVWIHGGGNTIGQGADYDGGNLAAAEHVVVVTLNYRLGPFGWFRHAALRGPGTSAEEQSGNFAILDLIRALQWVRDDIAAFGGDPGNVTIFGESAGGTDVYMLLLSPLAHGLFQRAIVESGGLRMRSAAAAENLADAAVPGDPNSSNEMLLRLLMRDGVAGDRAAAEAHLRGMSAPAVASYLRGKPSEAILRAYTPMPGVGMINMPTVFRDGVVLPDDEPLQRLARADGYNRVPVILGTNRDENKLFMFIDPLWVQKLLWIFPRLRDPRMYDLTAEYLAKMWKATAVDEPADALRAGGAPGVFVYRFDWHDEPHMLGADLSEMLGAAHGLEVPFVFGHFDLGKAGRPLFSASTEVARKELSSEMMSYWAEFAYSGDPQRGRGGQLPPWPAWDGTPAGSRFLVLDIPRDGGLQVANGSLTAAGLVAAVDTDPRLHTQRERCMIYHEFVRWSRGVTRTQYATIGKQGCAGYPFDAYPWHD